MTYVDDKAEALLESLPISVPRSKHVMQALAALIREVIEDCARLADAGDGYVDADEHEIARRIRALASQPATPETPREPIAVGTDWGPGWVEPATPPPQLCAAWCGRWLGDAGEAHSHPTLALTFDDAERRSRAFCTAACRDAGHPMNPRTP